MRCVLPFILLLVLSSVPLAATADSLWRDRESSSTFRFEAADGDWRIIRFEQPDAYLLDRGVRTGTVAFLGFKRGRRFVGQAFTFPPPHCDLSPRGFVATGALSDFGQLLTLVGEPPTVTSDCETVRGKRTELTYRFVRSLKKPGLLD